MRKKDYAFSVEALGSQWDVYRFVKDGKRGMVAFRQSAPASAAAPNGQWEIGFFKAGEFTPEQVKAVLMQGPN